MTGLLRTEAKSTGRDSVTMSVLKDRRSAAAWHSIMKQLSIGLRKSIVHLASVLRRAWLWWQKYLIVPCTSEHEALLGKINTFLEMSSAGQDPCLIETHG